MLTTKGMQGAIATCLLIAASSAYADEPTLTDPPSATQSCDAPDNSCPPAQTQTTQTGAQTGAQAQTTPTPIVETPPMTAPETYVPPPQPERAWYDTLGWGLAVGGGVDDFVSGPVRDTTGVGGGWTVRATAGTKQYIAGEVSYIGSSQSINALGLDNNANLVGNGVQGALRINMVRDYPLQPFIFGGGAWRHYDLTNVRVNTSDVTNHSDVFELPAGVGLAGYYKGVMADARGEYHFAWGNDILPGLSRGDMDRWNVTGNVGVEF